MSSTTTATALSMPRFRSIGFMPAATDFMPSLTIAWASTVAVVVPSPATSLVRLATSRTICAPMFSNLSFELDLLGDGDAVLGDARRAEGLVEDDVAALGAEGDLHRVGEMSTPRSMRSRASRLEFEVLGCHVASLLDVRRSWMQAARRRSSR